MSPEKKLATLAWHCGLDTKAAFQALAALEGMTASELLDRLATGYIERKATEARLVLEAINGASTVSTEGNDDA